VQTEFDAVVQVSADTQWGWAVHGTHWLGGPLASQYPEEQSVHVESVAEVQVTGLLQWVTPEQATQAPLEFR
jgi:hypothetical protein